MSARKPRRPLDMFAQAAAARAARQAPLAARMRPQTLDEFVGQEHLVGPGRVLRRAIEADEVPSMVLWGPPGSGKTTLARIIASLTRSHFEPVSAVASGVADLRRIVQEARDRLGMHPDSSGRTILFIDEIHRFNKAQQDVVLPYVEDGTITLIGATTENPSFEVISPLLSRSRVFRLEPLTPEQVLTILRRAINDEERGLAASLPARPEPPPSEAEGRVEGRRALADEERGLPASARPEPVEGRALPARPEALEGRAPDPATTAHPEPVEGRAEPGPSAAGSPESPAPIDISHDTLTALASAVGGDARIALNALELAAQTTPSDAQGTRRVTLEAIEDALQHRAALYDRAGDWHYDIISAFIKSLRGSDPDAALYWLARMLEGGEDPLFVARRLVILASEDVGLADPQALQVAVAAQQAVHFIGMPEGFYPLAQATIYLATAPKSNSVGSAYSRALQDAKATLAEPVPLHLRNPETPLMRDMAYGRDYQYDHAQPEHYSGQQHLPDALKRRTYYVPGTLGYEEKIREWLERLRGREKQEK